MEFKEGTPIGNRLDILHSAVRALRRLIQQNLHRKADMEYVNKADRRIPRLDMENMQLEHDIDLHEAQIKDIMAERAEL